MGMGHVNPKGKATIRYGTKLVWDGPCSIFSWERDCLAGDFFTSFLFSFNNFFYFFLYYNFFSNLLTVAWLTKQAQWLRNSKKLALSTFMGSGYFSSYAKVHRTLASLLCFCSHSCIILIGVCCQNQNYLWKSTKNHYNTNNAFFFLFNSYSNFCFVLK